MRGRSGRGGGSKGVWTSELDCGGSFGGRAGPSLDGPAIEGASSFRFRLKISNDWRMVLIGRDACFKASSAALVCGGSCWMSASLTGRGPPGGLLGAETNVSAEELAPD